MACATSRSRDDRRCRVVAQWRAPCLWRPLPASLAGGAGARPDHPITGHQVAVDDEEMLTARYENYILPGTALAAEVLPALFKEDEIASQSLGPTRRVAFDFTGDSIPFQFDEANCRTEIVGART